MVIRKGSISPPGQQIQILSADILKGLLGIPVQRREDFFFKYFSAASKFNGASVRCREGIPEAEHAVRYTVERPAASRILGNGNDLVHQSQQIQGVHKTAGSAGRQFCSLTDFVELASFGSKTQKGRMGQLRLRQMYL